MKKLALTKTYRISYYSYSRRQSPTITYWSMLMEAPSGAPAQRVLYAVRAIMRMVRTPPTVHKLSFNQPKSSSSL